MKNYKERAEGVLEKVKLKKAKRRNAVMACVTSFALAALIATNAIWLMPNSPFRVDDNNVPPITDVGGTDDSETDDGNDGDSNNDTSYLSGNAVMQTNNATLLKQAINSALTASNEGDTGSDGNDGNTSSSDNEDEKINFNDLYLGAEIFTNQIYEMENSAKIKTDGKNIYYIARGEDNFSLMVYSANEANLELITQHQIIPEEGFLIYTNLGVNDAELIISENGKYATVITQSYRPINYKYTLNGNELTSSYNRIYTTLIRLDLSNLYNIAEIGRLYFSGDYVSSQTDGNKLILTTNYMVRPHKDEGSEDERLFPHSSISSESVSSTEIPNCSNIFFPMEAPPLPEYAYVNLIDLNDFKILDERAFLSHSEHVFINDDNVFVYYRYEDYKEDVVDGLTHVTQSRKTDITILKITDNGFENIKILTINGYTNSQTVDVYSGVLRMFVSHADFYAIKEHINKNNSIESDLYVSISYVNMADLTVTSTIERVAIGGDAKLMRCAGNVAYLYLQTSPSSGSLLAVDFIDLNNIRTAKIEVDSTHYLGAFFNDTLINVSFGESTYDLKISIFKYNDSQINIIDEIELKEEYFDRSPSKYFIDDKSGTIALATCAIRGVGAKPTTYRYFNFDGNLLSEKNYTGALGETADTRAVLVGDYIYFINNTEHKAFKLQS